MLKSIRIGGMVVTVISEEQPDGSLLIRATTPSGDSHEHSLTVGAVDAPLPDDFGVLQAQADFDAAVNFAARMAESKSRSRSIIGQLN